MTIMASSALRDGNNQPISLSPESGVVIVEAAVPVQLRTFTGMMVQGRQVLLEWQTVSEINNYGFEVQRSTMSGGSFRTLDGGFLSGHGTTLVPQQYSYVDSSPGGGMLYYRLVQIDLDRSLHESRTIQVGNVTSVAEAVSSEYLLTQNYPNPFNPTTSIRYTIGAVSSQQPADSWVRLVVYDLLGREVAVLVDEKKTPGNYAVQFDGSHLGSGVYFYRMQSANYVETRKLLLLR
jgi:hypothetical protein